MGVSSATLLKSVAGVDFKKIKYIYIYHTLTELWTTHSTFISLIMLLSKYKKKNIYIYIYIYIYISHTHTHWQEEESPEGLFCSPQPAGRRKETEKKRPSNELPTIQLNYLESSIIKEMKVKLWVVHSSVSETTLLLHWSKKSNSCVHPKDVTKLLLSPLVRVLPMEFTGGVWATICPSRFCVLSSAVIVWISSF